MKKLNKYQEKMVLAAIAEEAAADVRIDTAMPLQTAELYGKYLQNDEFAFEALVELLDFWSCYFAFGAEEAYRIRDERHNKLMKHLEAQCEQRRLQEVF